MYLSRRLNRSLAPPDRVSVNLTLRCNLSCTMCTTCYDSPELSTDEVKAIIDQTSAWGVEVFNPLGGEPFMRADIEEILSYAVRRGFYVTVTTNGTLITERRAAAIAAIPTDRLHINISLDGDEETNDQIRGAGMWRRAITGYQRLRAADALAGKSRRKILANTILHGANLDRFLAVLDEQAQLGFDGVQVLNLFRAEQGQSSGQPATTASSNSVSSPDLWLRPDQLPRLEVLVETLAGRVDRQPAAGYRIQNAAEDLRKIPAYYRDELGPLEAPCWAGWKELYINADGAAIMCDGKLDFLAGTFGNIRQQTLRQLWHSPALAQRRRVVRTCQTPCVQDCYLRTRSDSGTRLLAEAGGLVAQTIGRSISRRVGTVSDQPGTVLRLELSDVVEATAPGCTTPLDRWTTLVAQAPVPPTVSTWAHLRDRQYLDFGRGFMGFEVIRSVCDDLVAARLRFELLSLRWRGEPLIHPEIEPILHYLLERIGRGEVARRLRIETSGAFLTPTLAALPVHEWIVDLDRAQGHDADAVALFASAPRVVVTARATQDTRPEALAARYAGWTRAAGRLPTQGRRVLWMRRTDHDNFRANALARQQLQRVADAWGVTADVGPEDSPRRCMAPARTPTVSWDGKLTLCPADVRLDNVVGDVTSGRLSEHWRGPALQAARQACLGGQGVPDRALCAGCAWPWSPNLPD